MMDDVLVHSETQHQHDQQLHEVLKQMQGAGVTLKSSF